RLRLEEVAALALEPERRQRAIVHAVARDARFEIRHERERVDRAERAVAVAADAHAVAVDVTLVDHRIDDHVQVLAQVARVVVVHLARVADDRTVRLDDRVTAGHPHLRRRCRARRRHLVELVDVRRVPRAVVLRLRRVLARIEPDDAGKTRARLPVARQREIDPELDAVARAGDLNPLVLRKRYLWADVDGMRELYPRVV